MAAPSLISPPDNELIPAVIGVKASNPELGIAKTLAAVLAAHPDWTVSEKRLKKILQNEGLIVGTNINTAKTTEGGRIYPSSRMIDDLDISAWTSKVQVRYFNKIKGKGLVAKEKIAAGEVIWKENPFILAPEWNIYDLQKKSLACAYCSTVWSEARTILPCSAPGTQCEAYFCNRLCIKRAETVHPLLCANQNPGIKPLLDFVRKAEWMAPHALAQTTARILLANQRSEQDLKTDWNVIRGLAELSMEDRARDGFAGGEPDIASWKKVHKLYLQAFQDPPDPAHKKKLAKILKKPLPQDITDALFPYDAFLRGLGRMSLNLEAHGGLYTLHAHMNHACTPNVSVRHLDQSNALSRITVLALNDIQPGEELFITYVDPKKSVRQRRQQLREWGFGLCDCARCVRESKAEEEEEAEKRRLEGKDGKDGDGENGVGAQDAADLEDELKQGFGLM